MSQALATEVGRTTWPTQHRVLWGVGAVLGVVLAAGETLTTHAATVLPETIGTGAINCFWLSLVVSPSRLKASRWLAITLATMLVSQSAVRLAFGVDAPEVFRIALGTTIFGLGVLWCRAKLQPGLTSWGLHTSKDLICVFLASLSMSIAVLPIGLVPDLYLGGSADYRELAWWVVRNVDFVFICLAVAPGLLHRGLPAKFIASPAQSALSLSFFCASVVALLVIFSAPDLALTFIIMLPLIVSGMVLRHPINNATVGAIGITAAVFCSLPAYRFDYDRMLPMPIVLDILVLCCAWVSLFLSLTRARNDELNRQVRRQASLIARVQDAMSEGFIVYSADGTPTLYNRTAEILLGRPPEDTASDWRESFSARHHDGSPIDKETIPDAPIYEGRITLRVDTNRGERIIQFDSSSFSPDPDDDRSSLVLLRDVTSEQERLEELRNFASAAAHDLKAPLAGLVGWLEQASSDVAELPGSRSGLEALGRAHRSARNMSRVVEDWLAYAVERHGNLELRPINLQSVLDDLLPTFAYDAGNGLPTFECAAPHNVIGDEALVRQLFANLVGNSIKYAMPGAKPRVEITSTPLDDGWIQVDVADNGIGIPDEDLTRVFGRFETVSDNTGRNTVDSTGLGLALCERIVSRHKGRIFAQANQAGGLVVSFTLPRAHLRAKNHSAASAEPASHEPELRAHTSTS